MQYIASIDWKNVDWGMWGVIVAVAIFVLGIIAAAIRAYYRLGAVESAIDKDVKPELGALKKKVDKAATDLGSRIDKATERIDKVHDMLLSIKLEQSGAVEGNSPRALTEKGERILNESGIKEIVDSRLGEIVTSVQARKPENEYRTEQYVIETVREFGRDQKLKDTIEEGAFNSGTTVDVVLFVGAIYIRDQVLAALEQKP
ncbi:MAG TPA: hypothetical protein VLI54_03595 [Bacillota bacterium]|nr:hypothetical protein [Bacillota bacterium]